MNWEWWAVVVVGVLDVIAIRFLVVMSRRSPYRERWQQIKDAWRGEQGR